MSGAQSAPFWGARTIAGVTDSTGDAVQLFPIRLAAATMADTTTQYPPAGGGEIRRPTEGRIERLGITCDDVAGGIVEIWDVAGLDRGNSDNVNDQLALTAAYLAANGTLLDSVQVKQSGTMNEAISGGQNTLAFEKGLAVRYIGDGNIIISPWIYGGFTQYYAPAPIP